MQIFVPKEIDGKERRVAVVPATVAKLIKLGATVQIEKDLGQSIFFSDADYQAAGATVATDRSSGLSRADMVLRLNKPSESDITPLKQGCIHVSYLDPFNHPALTAKLATSGASAICMEMIPRSTIAQKMDSLSSQANLGGYVAVVFGSNRLDRIFPMMSTPSGTIPPSKVFIIGVGVAGLQAIATAKRLGAVIEASDVRPSVKEQVESLGGKFIDVPYETDEEKEAAVGVGGYARPMPQSWLDRQKIEVAKRVAQADVVISTALIPGRAAPVLVTQEMVQSMKPGSVVIDIAAGKAADGISGNCVLTEAGKTVVKHGVTLVGETNLPALVAADASALYARNVLDFLKLVLTKEGAFKVDLEDDIVAACLMTQAGEVKRKT